MVPSRDADGNFNALIDLVTSFNQGNLSLYHEYFHMAYLILLNSEQRAWLDRYYSKQSGIPLSSAVELEEYIADKFMEYGRAYDKQSSRMVSKIWNRMIERLHGIMKALGLASKDAGDMFWDVMEVNVTLDSDKWGYSEGRNRLEPENLSKSKREIVNPIDSNLSDQEKVLQLEKLREEAIPIFRGFLNDISTILGLKTKDNLKDNEGAIEKTHRAGKPNWYSLEHLGDYYRGMVTLTDQRQIVDIAKMVQANGMGVVEFDYMKTISPEGYGYRDMNFILRMPNGLMVEFQAIMQEIADVKPELHKIYEKWRPYSNKQVREMGRWEERYTDMQRSYAGYNNAWRSALRKSGISHDELISSLMKDFTALGLVSTPKSSFSSSTVMSSSPQDSQVPSANRVNGITDVNNLTLLPSRSDSSITSDSFISTSNNKISQNSENATNSQGKSDGDTRHRATPRLVKVEWKAVTDFATGKKQSNWDASLVSEISGRDIVHVFWIDEGDGVPKPYGSQSAAKMLGLSQQRSRQLIQDAKREWESNERKIKAYDSEIKGVTGKEKSGQAMMFTNSNVFFHNRSEKEKRPYWDVVNEEGLFAAKDGKLVFMLKGQTARIEAYRRAGWEIKTVAEVREAERTRYRKASDPEAQMEAVRKQYEAKYLYHGTTSGAVYNILKEGIIPRQEGANGDAGLIFFLAHQMILPYPMQKEKA